MSVSSKNIKVALLEKEALLEADPLVQINFPLVIGDRLSSLHSYSLYSALKTLEPRLGENPTVLINSIAGTRQYNQQIETHCNSRLQLRVPISFASHLYGLAGERLSIGQGSICLQIPTITPLDSKPNLYSRIATISLRDHKSAELPPQLFLAAAQRQLENLGIRGGLLSLVLKEDKPIRRVIKIKERFITGYAIEVRGLSEGNSIKLQQLGLGGRPKMGCGWFE